MKQKNKKEVVWDIEGNGLLPELTDIWCLVTKDIHTESVLKFSDYDNSLPNMDYGIEYLDNVTNHIGHNILGYDSPAMMKIYGWEIRDDVKATDTWILSMLNRYKRTHPHGLGGWGEKLNFPKWEFDEWHQYSKRMLNYCEQDVNLNHEVYKRLHAEAVYLIKRNPLFSKRIECEMFVARMNMRLNQKGWVYDQKLSTDTQAEINKKISKIENLIEPKLGLKRNFKDKEPKYPKYTKAGWYNSNTARMLTEFTGKTVLPEDARSEHPPIKPGEGFQRYEDVPIKLGNAKEVKEYLMHECGWVPDEFNRKKNSKGRWVDMSPILDGPALEALGEVGKGVKEYAMLSHRRSAFEGFDKMAAKRGDGRISGNMWTIGTPTFRVRHEGIVNLPKVKVPYGLQIRRLFTTEPDRKIIGADSAGNQLRGFCHVVGNEEYTAKVLGQDPHDYHAALIGCSRDEAKVFIYRILFGSTAIGLGFAFGKSEEYAQSLIDAFKKEIPEFDAANQRLAEEWHRNNGFIFGETGNLLFVEEEKNLLNSYLQDLEKATCSASMKWSWDKMREEGIDAYPCIFYHDEDAFSVADCDVERAAPIIREGFKEGPKWFNVDIMDGGDAAVGTSYADVH